ncbi:OTU domain-containing protein [Abeliophyllum distichum]|uniref:Ubiquitin thioesterase OTU n=1 Tax=Abeliophyllum distichum TaxID=126358 RepID=A0ABD1V973_9LAMI
MWIKVSCLGCSRHSPYPTPTVRRRRLTTALLGLQCAQHSPAEIEGSIRSTVRRGAPAQRRYGTRFCLRGGGSGRRGATMLYRHEHEGLKTGEGSWNVAWDARPARWLHHPDSAWLLFGVCACLATPLLDFNSDVNCQVPVPADKSADGFKTNAIISDSANRGSSNYRVTGVPADGRCLFRAIAHMACLRNGEKAPDENRQRELADELRAQVVEELLKRRKEVEWFIEEDFDTYVKRIKQPYVWGGEPELLMASHVLRTPISVFMIERGSTGSLIKIANYGEEYSKEEESPIGVLFHGYGHYDILETILDQSQEKVEA